MTQAIGLASALVILAFLLILYALLTVTVKRYLDGDTQAARGPLVITGVLSLVALFSVFTWAGSAVSNAVSSVGWVISSTQGLVDENPLSLICIGPLIFVILFTLATPGARRWIGGNYLPLSVLVLAVSFLAGTIYLALQVTGGWGALALLVVAGVIVGLGSRGLVFVPALNDGPRLGEGAASSLLRITGAKARRNARLASGFLASFPSRMLSRQGASSIGLIAVIAFGGWWYSGRSEAQPENPVAVIVLGSPTAVPVGTVSSDRPTSTPGISSFRVVNTGSEGLLMRDQPSRSGKAVASLTEGATLAIAGPEQTADGVTWRQVKEKGGKVGWVSTQYLAAERVYGAARIGNTGGEGVNLRVQPSKSAKIVTLLKEGTELKIIGEDTTAEGSTWRNVRDDQDHVGWVSSQYTVPSGN
ncbi:MAG: SH3 domain-containing protein [Chloroflexi bacterium]|nr:SH3 domain-containing protein [Chloroflexota bacterium]